MTNKRHNILFVVLAYAFFWVVLIAGGSLMLLGNEALFNMVLPYVQIIGTWAPTLALLVLFKKLYPGLTIREFYQNAFKERLHFKLLLVVTIIYALIVFVLVGITAFAKGVALGSLLRFSFSGFVITLFSGAMGEESGWRGHLQNSIEKKHSVIKTSIIIGIIWAFWHTPTWFISGMAGMDLLRHILLDILIKLSSALIMGICYSRCKNLFVPMWIHFVANILLNAIQGMILDVIVWYALLHALAALGYAIWYKKTDQKEISAA